jgi:hypothetical protein
VSTVSYLIFFFFFFHQGACLTRCPRRPSTPPRWPSWSGRCRNCWGRLPRCGAARHRTTPQGTAPQGTARATHATAHASRTTHAPRTHVHRVWPSWCSSARRSTKGTHRAPHASRTAGAQELLAAAAGVALCGSSLRVSIWPSKPAAAAASRTTSMAEFRPRLGLPAHHRLSECAFGD